MNFFEFFPFTSFLLFVILITRKTIVLKRKGVSVSSNSPKSTFVKYFLYPVFLLIITLFISELVKPILKTEQSILPEFITQNLFNSISLKIFGSILITTSITSLFFTLRSFNKSLRFGMDSENLGELITTGVFSISRNPFFVSIIIYFTGISLFYPNPFFIAYTVLTIVSIHLFILKEEKFLRNNYGKEYDDYTKNVRRYF